MSLCVCQNWHAIPNSFCAHDKMAKINENISKCTNRIIANRVKNLTLVKIVSTLRAVEIVG